MSIRNPFDRPSSGFTPGIRPDPTGRLDTTVPSLNIGGFTGQNPGVFGRLDTTAQTPIAGRFLNLDKERIQQFKDAFGSEMGAMAYLIEQQRMQASDPQRMKEMLDILGPYQKDVARESQRLGQESALFAGILDLPNKASRAMAASHYYVPETMQAIAQGIGRQTPFVNRQYTSL